MHAPMPTILPPPDWIEKIVGEMEKDRSIIAMGAWLEVLSEEKDGNRLADRKSVV